MCKTDEERDLAITKCERAIARPFEIRGIRLCKGCSRCLNRDANSAPQMAVQLKRLLVGAGALHKKSAAEKRLERTEIQIILLRSWDRLNGNTFTGDC